MPRLTYTMWFRAFLCCKHHIRQPLILSFVLSAYTSAYGL